MPHDTAPTRPRGRPMEREWPELIPDTLENVMRALAGTAPKAEKEWQYLREHRDND